MSKPLRFALGTGPGECPFRSDLALLNILHRLDGLRGICHNPTAAGTWLDGPGALALFLIGDGGVATGRQLAHQDDAADDGPRPLRRFASLTLPLYVVTCVAAEFSRYVAVEAFFGLIRSISGGISHQPVLSHELERTNHHQPEAVRWATVHSRNAHPCR